MSNSANKTLISKRKQYLDIGDAGVKKSSFYAKKKKNAEAFDDPNADSIEANVSY